MNEPTFIARCINHVARDVCGAKIFDDDEDAVQIGIGWICGRCTNSLIGGRAESNLDSRGQVNPFKRKGRVTRRSAYCGVISRVVTRGV